MPEEKIVNLGGTIEGFPVQETGSFNGGNGVPPSVSVNDIYNSIGKVPTGRPSIDVNSFYTGDRYSVSLPGTDTEEMAAQQQSSANKWINAIGKMAGVGTGAFVSGTAGLIYGIGKAAYDGKFSSLYNNEVTQSMDDMTKYLEDALPNYYTAQERDADWWSPDNLFTANFWADKVLKNLGYSAGALGGGIVWAQLLKGIGLTNKLVKAGRTLELVEATEKAMTAVPRVQQFAALQNTLSSLGQKFLQGPAASILKSSDRIITSAMGTFGEASLEALQNMNEFRKNAIEEYKATYGVEPTGAALDEINDYSTNVGNFTWGFNTMLLTGTNYIQLPKLLGSSRKNDKLLLGDIERDLSKPVGSQWYTPRPGLISKTKGAASLFFAPSEAFEEGAQFAIQTGTDAYFNRAYENKEDVSSFFSSLAGAFSGTLNEGVEKTLSTKEGLESILIGGFAGGIQQARGTIGQEGLLGTGGERGRNTQLAVSALNKTSLSKVLQDQVNYTARAINSQRLRLEAIANNDVLSEKDFERDYALSYIMPRVKYGKVDSINEEVDYYLQQSTTAEGFDELKSEGIVNPNETREQFVDRINNIKALTQSVNGLYSQINDKYSAFVDENGNRIFSDDVVDRMVYSASKVSDYTKRIPEVNNSLLNVGINTQSILDGIIANNEPSVEATREALDQINGLDILSEEKDDLKRDLQDVIELSLRRKMFIDDYDGIRRNPKAYKEVDRGVKVKEPIVVKQSVVSEDRKKTIDKELELGREYSLKQLSKIEDGKLTVAPKLTVLSKTLGGEYEVRLPDGKETFLKPEEFKAYELSEQDVDIEDVTKLVDEAIDAVLAKDAYKNVEKPTGDKVAYVNSLNNEALLNDIEKEIQNRSEELLQTIAKEEEFSRQENIIKELEQTAETGVQTAEFDKKYEATAKKADDIIPRATMGVVRGKAHQVRANAFGFNLNSFPNRKNIRGVYVTSKNEDQILPGLTDLLRMDEAGQINEDIKKDEIIAFVMVQENADGEIELVGENGQPIVDGANALNLAVFQVFPDGDLKWGAEFDNESMFRDPKNEDRKEIIKSLTEQYKVWRTSVLENPTLSERHEIEASFGRVENVKDASGNTIYTTRTSVQDANLISADELESTQLIKIPTLPTEEGNVAVENKGTVTFKVPVGTPLLETANGLVKLQNKKHSEEEAETIYQAILQLAKYMIDPKVGVKDSKSQRLLTWLKSTVYWGIPEDQQKRRKPAGYNSVFFEKDAKTNKLMLTISSKGKDFVFTPSALEKNKEEIVNMLSSMYNNINNNFAKQLNEPYEEILSISESGDVTSRIWKNYQSYLLSNTTPDGKVRSGEDLPLSTTMRPTVGAEDVNRTNIYFYTTDTADDFVVPVVEKKKLTVPKVLTPGAPTPTTTTYKLDGSTPQTYTSPEGKKIMFTAPVTTTAENANTEIKILKGGDLDEVVAKIKAAGKDPGEILKKTVFNAIAPTLNEMKAMEADLTVIIPDDVEEVVVADAESKLGKPIDQDIIDAVNENIIGLDNEALRVAVEQELTTFVPENWDQVEAWLNNNFHNIPVYFLKNIIQATNGRQAWGMFKDGAIYVYENAEVGTVYHEVFHAVWRMFSDSTEQKAVLDEMRARGGKFYDRASLQDISYSEATEEQLEEKLAEEFRDYVQEKKIPAKPAKGRPYVLKLFADMVTAIKEFFFGPNSDSKVNQMFGKIGQGYYKSHIPFQNNLAFAREGLIDIEDAFADLDSVLSLSGITDRERSDIVQHMTYLMLTDMIKTDESLFNIEKKNKKDQYAKLKYQIYRTIAQKARSAQSLVREGKKTQAEVNPYISNVLQLMQNVKNQWDLITEKHEEYLKSYQIEFDENDQIILRDENNSGRETYQDATKIDNFKKANSAIKLLLATIPQVNDAGKIIPSSIGGAQLLPATKTYISLMNNLHTSASIEEMLNRLRQMAVSDPNYRTLYRRITKRDWKDAGVDLSKVDTQHGLQLISSLWNTFKKQNPDVRNVFILENGDVVVGEANLTSAAQQLRSEYINSIVFKAKEGEGFFTYDQKEKVFKGDPSKLKGVNLNSPTAIVDFLNRMGVPFTISDINKMTPEQYKVFKGAVLGIKESISKTEKVATFSGKALGMSGRLLELGLVKSAVSNPEFSSTYFNVSGERTQSFIGTNAASDLYEFLSKLERFNKESVGGTRYSYLLTDSFAKGSNLLSRMFTENGTRKQNTEELFKIGYVSGLINEEKGKRKESSRLNYKERLIQEINLNLSGYYLNLIPGDASIEWMINMGNAISTASIRRGMKDINDVFKGYFLSELELLRENRPVAKGRKSNEMRFFKGILGEELHNNVIAETGTPEEIYNKFEESINKKLADFVKKDMNKFKQLLSQYDIIKEGAVGVEFENLNLPKNISNQEADVVLTGLTVNYMIANIEMHKLLYSDPYQYEDELKRIKSFNSPRQAIINNSPKMNTALSNVWNKGYQPGDIGFTKFTQDYFRSATHKDVIGIIDLPNYTAFKETDGSGIISMKANRQFRIRSSNWNDAEELQYKYDIAWEKDDKGIPLTKEEREIFNAGNPGVKSAYTPLKPIVSGSKLSKEGLPNSYNDVVLDKFALYPLSYRIMKEIDKDANAVKLYDKMQREDIDYVVFASGRKVGAEQPHDTYKDGVFNDDPYKGIINVPFSIMSIQAEVSSKEDNLVTRGSQITKLITLDFMEAGVPVDFFSGQPFANRYKAWYKLSEAEKSEKSEIYKEVRNNQELLEALIEEGYKTTLDRLGIKETTDKDGKKKFEIVDFSKAAQTLRDEILKREVNDNISAAVAGFLQGNVVLEATPAYQQVRNIIYSIADKQFVSPKISGGMKVQIPSTFIENGVRNVKDGLYESDVLKFYEKGGKRVAEVMLGRWFDSDLSDSDLLDYLNNTEEGQKILSGVGYRIPTQKQNSVDVIVVKKFLPKEFGDSVVIPAALVQKVGSDFDIDKLSVYLKNVYVKNGKPKLVPYFGIGEQAIDKFKDLFDKGEFLTDEEIKELDRYISEEQLLLQEAAEDSASGRLMTSIFGKLFSEEELTQEFTRGIPSKDQIISRLYKKSLENEYIQSMENLITHPKNYDNLIKPNSADPLKNLAGFIAEKTVGESFDYTNVDNMLDRTFMSRLRHAFVTGKYAIGIAAVNQTNHSLNQRQPVYIDKSRLDRVSNEDRFWLGNADIRFDKYNSIEVDGKMVPTLSMITNKAGENISDIIGMFIDGYVDISKGPWIMELGATPNVASTWLFLTKLGVPIKTIAYFMNQPIIRDYLRTIENAGYSWLFIDQFVKNVAETYDQYMTETELNDKLATFKIPGEETLKRNVGKKPSELTAQQKTDQYLMLMEFLKYAKMGEHMFHVTQGSNYDTSTFNDPYLVFKKQMQQTKAQNTIISSVDTLLANSFIGKLASTVNNVRDAFAQILKSDSPKVRNVIQKVLTPYVETNDREFVKLAQKAVNDLFDWAVQTDQQLNNMIKDILVNDGGVGREVTLFVNDIKSKGASHPLFNNEVINIIEGIPSVRAAIGGPNNVKLNLGENKVYNQNNVIYAFRQLRDHLKGESNPLYDRIVTLSILQSGLSTSPISFTNLLPYEDFENIYNKTLSKLEGMSNLDDFYKLGVFQRNNWNNDDITPYLKAALIKTKTGRTHYNPSMKFLPDVVKQAIVDNDIPPILTRSKRNKESNFDYLVYTWEKQEELLTKEELDAITIQGGSIYKAIANKKSAMRQAGDYSYINKALFKKVYDDYGEAFEQTSYDGQKYFVYKAINAWGDSFRANEFWATDHKSELENGFLEVEDVDNNVIISKFLESSKTKTSQKPIEPNKDPFTC